MYYHPVNPLVQEAAMYDMLANYYKYLDPQKHIYYYQLHYNCMQQLCQAQATPFRNNDKPAKVRVLHASPDAPRVDIYVNGEKTLDNMTYYQISPYVDLPAGTYRIDVYPAGQTTNRVLSERVTVQSDVHYTVAAAGRLEDLRLVAVEDETNVSRGKSKVRFWHLSPNAPAVDIALENGDVLFENASFSNASQYLELNPGTYTLEVRRAGTDDVVLTLRNTPLKANEVYTITAIGLVDGRPRLEAMIIQP